jgi:insertion element IS1 protein InsB
MRCGALYNQNSKARWLWQAVDHVTAEVLAYVLNTGEDRAFLELKALLQPFGIQHFYTDGWGTYERHQG